MDGSRLSQMQFYGILQNADWTHVQTRGLLGG